MQESVRDQKGLLEALVGDGRPLLAFTGLSLVLSGLFALFLAATGHFLPQDVRFLGMTVEDLCAVGECRVVRFMTHDRVAFGGSLVAIGALYMWLGAFPLRWGEAWAWQLFAVSGAAGFGSFLAYLGYGYLDTWHGAATLVLLPLFVFGLIRSHSLLSRPVSLLSLLRPSGRVRWTSAFGIGRACLLATAAGMMLGGATITTVGMTTVFVPQDLDFMGLLADDLREINPRLVPLIAHDRAGFGGGLFTTGIAVFFCVWCGRPSKSLWQVLCFSGMVGFAAAIGVHPLVGYNDLSHLAPAFAGALLFATGLVLTYRPMHGRTPRPDAEASGERPGR